MGPKNVTVRDYNYRMGGEPIENSQASSSKTATGYQAYYGEHFKSDNEGRALASVRLEEIDQQREQFEGEISVPGVHPGNHFELVNHPLGLDQQLLVTSVEES